MLVWLILLLLSALIGALAAWLLKSPVAILVGAAAAWFGLLAWLLFSEYCLPYQGGGASMWPIAQLFAGTIAAVVAGLSAAITFIIRTATIGNESEEDG